MVRLRHKCTTKYIGKVNQNLTGVQKEKIDSTPFKWLMFLPERINISGILLEELCRRWDEKSWGFRIQSRMVRFSPLDVCYAVGLGIVGEEVQFEDDMTSYTLTLLEGTNMSLTAIYEKMMTLSGDENVDDFCRLYILLALEEFYFPNTSSSITCRCIKLLDSLDTLGTFNWGLAVYYNLVDKLNKVSETLAKSDSSTCLYLMGCVVVLQVWGIEHVWPNHKTSPRVERLFPRCLKWFDIRLDRKQVMASFKKNQVFPKLTGTKEERTEIDVVIEAFNQSAVGIQTLQHPRVEELEAEQKLLEERLSNVERDFNDLTTIPQSEREKLQGKIDELQRELLEVKESKAPLDSYPTQEQTNEPVFEPLETGDVNIETKAVNADHDDSNMQIRRRRNPRRVKESVAIKTPYQTYGRKRKVAI